jgi:uncharacterized protein YceH (UPF0502 family)
MLNTSLTHEEIRVVGTLLEKEILTPDLYPLSINALLNACNQKTGRDPITSFTLEKLEKILDSLMKKSLVVDSSRFNSRTVKFSHRFCNTEFSELQFSRAELSILCLLFLRGSQTIGELKNRSGRLYNFSSLTEVELTLENLSTKTNGPFIRLIEKKAGMRELRYDHNFLDTHTEEIKSKVTLENISERLYLVEESIKILNERVEQLTRH